MGEASRRRKLDPSYGKVTSLRTPSLKNQHSEKIFHELLKQFQVEFYHLFNAETVPENYQTVTEQVRLWLKDKLLIYRESDRAYIAKFIFYLIVGGGEKANINPLATSCIFKAVKDYFTPDELQSLLDHLDKDLKKKGKSSITNSCVKFVYEEIAQEAKLSLQSKS
jgi:hypothetical protein